MAKKKTAAAAKKKGGKDAEPEEAPANEGGQEGEDDLEAILTQQMDNAGGTPAVEQEEENWGAPVKKKKGKKGKFNDDADETPTPTPAPEPEPEADAGALYDAPQDGSTDPLGDWQDTGKAQEDEQKAEDDSWGFGAPTKKKGKKNKGGAALDDDFYGSTAAPANETTPAEFGLEEPPEQKVEEAKDDDWGGGWGAATATGKKKNKKGKKGAAEDEVEDKTTPAATTPAADPAASNQFDDWMGTDTKPATEQQDDFGMQAAGGKKKKKGKKNQPWEDEPPPAAPATTEPVGDSMDDLDLFPSSTTKPKETDSFDSWGMSGNQAPADTNLNKFPWETDEKQAVPEPEPEPEPAPEPAPPSATKSKFGWGGSIGNGFGSASSIFDQASKFGRSAASQFEEKTGGSIYDHANKFGQSAASQFEEKTGGSIYDHANKFGQSAASRFGDKTGGSIYDQASKFGQSAASQLGERAGAAASAFGQKIGSAANRFGEATQWPEGELSAHEPPVDDFVQGALEEPPVDPAADQYGGAHGNGWNLGNTDNFQDEQASAPYTSAEPPAVSQPNETYDSWTETGPASAPAPPPEPEPVADTKGKKGKKKKGKGKAESESQAPIEPPPLTLPPDTGAKGVARSYSTETPMDEVHKVVGEVKQASNLAAVPEVSESNAYIPWYASGKPLDPSVLGTAVDAHVFQEMQRNMPDYRVVTWDQAEPIVEKEKSRRQSHDWGRVMCYFMVHKVSGPGKVRLVMLHDGQSHVLGKGSNMLVPAVDFPPTAFSRSYRRKNPMRPVLNKLEIEDETNTRPIVTLSYWERMETGSHRLHRILS